MANGWLARLWASRVPLDPDASPAALEFWIDKATSDEWAFADLQRLVGAYLDAGLTLPPALLQWALETASGRHKVTMRRGPKHNPKRDAAIAATVELMTVEGMSQRAAFESLGAALRMSPKAIESARRRGWTV